MFKASITIAMVEFVFIVIYHIVAKVKSNTHQRFNNKTCLHELAEKFKSEVCCFSREPQDFDSERADLLPQALPPVINNDEYREPLIGNTNS